MRNEQHTEVLWEGLGIPRLEIDELFADFKLRPLPLTGQRDPMNERGVVAFAS